MAFVKLGHKFGDDSPISSPSEEKEHFPTLFIDLPKGEDLDELPQKGEALIKYEIVSSTKRQVKDGDGEKTTRSLEIKVKAIGNYKEPEDALDKIRDEVEGD